MSKKLLIFVLIGFTLVFVLVVAKPTLAYDTSKIEVLDDYNPTLLPDSPFYFLKTWLEKIQELLTISSVSKAELYLKLANKRLVEAQKLMEKGKEDLAQKLLQKFEDRIQKAISKAEEAKGEGKDVEELITRLTANSVRQQEVLAKVYDKVSEQAQEAILKAMEKSSRGLANAVQNVQGIHKKQEFENKLKDIIEKSSPKIKEKMREKLQLRGLPWPR